MHSTDLLDSHINRAAYRTAIWVLVITVISLFFTYDAPAGSSLADKVIWLTNNNGQFLAGWIVQIFLMFTLSFVFIAACWTAYKTHPLGAALGLFAVLLAVMAYLLNKFTEIWTVTLAAQAIASGLDGRDTAATLLSTNSQSYPYSYTQTLDYLGFWLYGLFGLCVARALFKLSLSAKIAAVSFGVYGLIFPVFYLMAVFGAIPQAEIVTDLSTIVLLLWVGVIAMGFYYRGLVKAAD